MFQSPPVFASEGELNPIRRVYPDAMLEHMAHMASTAESEEVSELFLGPQSLTALLEGMRASIRWCLDRGIPL